MRTTFASTTARSLSMFVWSAPRFAAGPLPAPMSVSRIMLSAPSVARDGPAALPRSAWISVEISSTASAASSEAPIASAAIFAAVIESSATLVPPDL